MTAAESWRHKRNMSEQLAWGCRAHDFTCMHMNMDKDMNNA
jgi:hypothetical protein